MNDTAASPLLPHSPPNSTRAPTTCWTLAQGGETSDNNHDTNMLSNNSSRGPGGSGTCHRGESQILVS